MSRFRRAEAVVDGTPTLAVLDADRDAVADALADLLVAALEESVSRGMIPDGAASDGAA